MARRAPIPWVRVPVRVRRLRLPPHLPDPGNDPRFRSSWPLRLVRKLPVIVVSAPERVVLNAAFVLIGMSAFVADTGDSIVSNWAEWIKFGFAGAMIVGGALGNVIDRVRFGYVVDFIKTLGGRFPVFNIADSAVVVGILLMVVYTFLADASGESRLLVEHKDGS